MSSNWKTFTVGELTINHDAKRIPVKEADRKHGKYPYYGASGIVDWVDQYIFDGEFLLVAEDGENLRSRKTPVAFMAKGKFWVNNHAHIIQGNEKANTRFLSYVLEAKDISGYLTGSTIPKLSQGNLNAIELEVPSVKEQKEIADILGAIDNKIELNRTTSETLEGIAKALFKSWFVDFDPVRAKAEGRPTGLPNEISELFPDSFEDSKLGEIPSGWRICPLTEILQVDPKRSLPKGSISPYLEMKGVPTSGHSAEGVYKREFTSGTKFQNGDTLLARITPCLENGKTAMVDFLDDNQIGWGSTEFIILCGVKPEHNSFGYYLARSNEFREHAIRNMVGSSGRQRVPSDSLKDFLLPKAPAAILDRFSSWADSLLKKISHSSKENSILSELRDTLLPKLISGELRVPDAEKMLEEVGI